MKGWSCFIPLFWSPAFCACIYSSQVKEVWSHMSSCSSAQIPNRLMPLFVGIFL
jgi:hypothetical protein